MDTGQEPGWRSRVGSWLHRQLWGALRQGLPYEPRVLLLLGNWGDPISSNSTWHLGPDLEDPEHWARKLPVRDLSHFGPSQLGVGSLGLLVLRPQPRAARGLALWGSWSSPRPFVLIRSRQTRSALQV